MNTTKISCPNCGAELSISVEVTANSETVSATPLYPQNINATHIAVEQKKHLKAEEKIEALRKAGVNVDNLFSMKQITGEETIARYENGHMVSVSEDDPVFAAILAGGTVPNSQLFRRWVMAQVFHMLATDNFTKALQNKGFGYQWRMLEEELRAQAKMLEHGDLENFNQRNVYYNRQRVLAIANDYIVALKKHIELLPRKRCKGISYIRLKGKNIFESDIQSKIINPLNLLLFRMSNAENPTDLYKLFVSFHRQVKKTWMDNNTPMSATFKDSYKGAGAYFTMRNLILFHNARFRHEKGCFTTQDRSLAILKAKTEEYKTEGWRLFGVMKLLIKDNDINIKQKIAEWRK